MNESRFLRWARVVADFGSPFYREERQRDVWNEASALGFQAGVWLTLLAATVAIWVGGWSALPYVVGFVLVTGVTSWLTMAYAARLGVQVDAGHWLSRPRVTVAGLLAAVLVLGVVRACWEHSASTGLGAAVGAASGAVGGALALRQVRRRRTEFDVEAD